MGVAVAARRAAVRAKLLANMVRKWRQQNADGEGPDAWPDEMLKFGSAREWRIFFFIVRGNSHHLDLIASNLHTGRYEKVRGLCIEFDAPPGLFVVHSIAVYISWCISTSRGVQSPSIHPEIAAELSEHKISRTLWRFGG